MKDYRLYYYESGQLKKWSNLKNQYYFVSLEDVESFIERINSKPRHKREGRQWVITEYFNQYDSKIIKLV